MKGAAHAFAVLGLLFALYSVGAPKANALDVNYYSQPFTDHWCPLAPAAISAIVSYEVSLNKALAAQLLRLHFHDCFVRGCDGSALIFKSTGDAERDGLPNKNSLAGFEIIDKVKAAVEFLCPRTVSCADIVAQAARDAVVALAGLAGPFVSWDVPLGRKDGNISLASDANTNLPSPLDDITALISKFGSKGLSAQQLVILSGGHTIGTASCPIVGLRLYPVRDPASELLPAYADYLQSECPSGSPVTTRVAMKDFLTNSFSNNFAFDNQYYINVNEGKGLFRSDNALRKSPTTKQFVDQYAGPFGYFSFINDFKGAMIAMGNIEVLTTGYVRKNCSVAFS